MANYYIDFAVGADTNNGTSQVTPWKHCPGDANATNNAASKTPTSGDIFYFKGGVHYYGKIDCQANGAFGSGIIYSGNNGWGTGKAIIDGSSGINFAVCTASGTGAGQVPNPNFASIYSGVLPPNCDWLMPVFESDSWLNISRTQNSNPIPFFFEDTEYFTGISAGITATSCMDSGQFYQSDPNYWSGSQILVHVAGNSVSNSQITGYDTGLRTVYYANLGTPMADSNWDNKYHYSVVNNVRLMTGAGQYAIDAGRNTVFVWPRADINQVTLGVRSYGFHTNGCSYNTIDGFVVQGHYSNGFVQGRAINASSSNPSNGILIQNCDIKNHQAYGATAGVYIRGAGTDQCSIQNNTFSYMYGRGAFVAGRNIAIKNNNLQYLTETCIYSQNYSTESNSNGEFSNNYVNNCRGVHQNAMTVYGGATAPATDWVVKNNVVLNMTQRYGNFGMSAQLHKNMLVYNNLIAADGGYAGDDLATGCDYFRFYNNTMVVPSGTLGTSIAGLVRIFGLANCATGEFRNNICNGLYVSDSGSAGTPYNFTHIEHTNNIYTSLNATQIPAYNWALSTGEITGTNLASNLFVATGANNFALKAGALAIGSGLNLSSYFAADINGATRTVPWDIGAYAYTIYVLKRLGSHIKFKGLFPV